MRVPLCRALVRPLCGVFVRCRRVLYSHRILWSAEMSVRAPALAVFLRERTSKRTHDAQAQKVFLEPKRAKQWERHAGVPTAKRYPQKKHPLCTGACTALVRRLYGACTGSSRPLGQPTQSPELLGWLSLLAIMTWSSHSHETSRCILWLGAYIRTSFHSVFYGL